jgi:hypothetical protein
MSFDGTRLPSGLFDYQEAAVQHCIRRLSAKQPAVLGLGTGLGKTLVARECLRRLNLGRALVVCPSGLVGQLAAGLASAPWAPEPDFLVRGADTGKQLWMHVRNRDLQVLVVNAALKWDAIELVAAAGGRFSLLVVDEAHKMNAPYLLRVLRVVEPGAVLYMSATYENLTNVLADGDARGDELGIEARAQAQRQLEAEFPQQEPTSGLSAMGQRLLVRKRRFALQSAARGELWEARRREFVQALFSLEKTDVLAKAVGGAVPKVVLRRLPGSEDTAPVGYLESLASSFEMAMDRGHGWPRVAAPIAAEVLGIEVSRLLPRPSYRHMEDDEYEDVVSRREKALRHLHSAHLAALAFSNASGRPPWCEPLPQARCLLARFDLASRLSTALQKHPPAPGVLVLPLTSALSSARRAKIVSSLSAGKAVAGAIRRASQASGPLARVLCLGNAWFLREMLLYVAPRLVVLAADQSLDLGYDLHRHLDAVSVKEIPVGGDELQQLLGRVCRADVSRIGKGDAVSVVVDAHPGTLDRLYLMRCGVESSLT